MDVLKTILVEIAKVATQALINYLLTLIPTKKYKKKTSRKKSGPTKRRSSKRYKV
ncbi:hypothetical protein ACFU1R_06045 [Priestia megaterium]|uniref:hypothetical protein n=1 Tax=Priestia megaterium TaxID=1404 RepID=UPI00366A65C5